MRLAMLPFNTAEGVSAAVGRQFAQFLGGTLRDAAGAEVGMVSLLAQLPDQDGRMAFVNFGDGFMEEAQIRQFFQDSDIDLVVDGLLRPRDGGGIVQTVRFHHKGSTTQPISEEREYPLEGIFGELHALLKRVAQEAKVELPPQYSGETLQFGTGDPEALLKSLEGADALMYVQQAGAQVSADFDPEVPIQKLLDAVEADPDFESPYVTLLQLCRQLAQHQIGKFETVRDALRKLSELVPDDYRAHYVLGEVYGSLGDFSSAADEIERAVEIEPNEPALYARLGMAQMNMGMPVNAERNFRKSLEMEGDDKPSADLLAGVLIRTGRAHEVPSLWKELVEKHSENASFHAKYAMALLQAGNEAEAFKVFDSAIGSLPDTLPVKRAYAPVLAQKDDLDRAMDFYEDWLDENPTDVQAMFEYAQTLARADREFEVPDVLRNILAAEPDQNTKANVAAWLIELEQPKRAEAVRNAEQKMFSGDYEGAIRDLKPMRNWLADYWKLWAVLASAQNKVGHYDEAEEAAQRVISIFPGCEPAYGELLGALTGQGRHEEAYNAMRWAAQSMPGSLGIALNLGLAAKRAGHQEEARDYARRIREAMGPNTDIEPVLAEIEA